MRNRIACGLYADRDDHNNIGDTRLRTNKISMCGYRCGLCVLYSFVLVKMCKDSQLQTFEHILITKFTFASLIAIDYFRYMRSHRPMGNCDCIHAPEKTQITAPSRDQHVVEVLSYGNHSSGAKLCAFSTFVFNYVFVYKFVGILA